MASEEKRAWIMAVVTIGAYVTYLMIILRRAGEAPLADVSYVATMLWTIGAAIVVAIVLHIGVGIAAGIKASTEGNKEANQKDQRDREIDRFGERIGQSFVVLGGVAALGMAMIELDHFWIANAIYLAFALSGVLSSVAKIFAYRRGFQPW